MGMLKSRLPQIVLAGTVGLFLVVGAMSLSTADFGANHDDGINAVTGRSLAATGEYRITSLPGEPFHRKYSVVFPAMLAVVWWIAGDFPGTIVWLKAVSLLSGAVVLCLTNGLLRTVGASGWVAAVIAGVCAALPATGTLANDVMSQLAYGASRRGCCGCWSGLSARTPLRAWDLPRVGWPTWHTRRGPWGWPWFWR